MENKELFIETLLSKMSLRDKIGQVTLIPYNGEEIEDFFSVIEKIRPGALILAGSALAGSDKQKELHRKKIDALQNYSIKMNGIPLLFGRDVIHGHKVAFPVPLTMTASFDFDLIEKCYDAIRAEASADGINWTFTPMLDMARDMRWGRIVEGTGEDPYLGECFAGASIKGIQKNKDISEGSLVACAKHFVGYGASEGGRDYNHAEISEYSLQNYYLPAFRAAAESGVGTVMSAFNDYDGLPVNASRKIMTEILRDQLKFSGFVVSDWEAVSQMADFSFFAEDKRECAKLAINAGVDMDMTSNCYLENMESLLETGELSEETLNEAVRRILRVKAEFGLFDGPVCKNNRYNLNEHLKLSEEIAKKSMVLLKNKDGILPLDRNTKIGLMGPFADETLSHAGTWSLDFDETLINSLNTELNEFGADFKKIDCLRDASIFGAQCVVLALGDNKNMTGEAMSAESISIPEEQAALIKKAKRYGLPIIGLLYFARPVVMGEYENYFDALLYVGHAGTMAAKATVEVLFGNSEPQGRIPFTMPYSSGQVPIYYNSLAASRTIYSYYNDTNPFHSSYIDADSKPLYPFGYGLSYSEFEYSEVASDDKTVSYEDIKNGKKLRFAVNIKNIGSRKAITVPELYIHDITASRLRPLRQLRGFKKYLLKAGETVRADFEIGFNDLGFYLNDGSFVLEKGFFDIYIGESSVTENKIRISVV